MKRESLIKKEIVEIGKEICRLGYAPASDGNISCKYGGKIFITPSGKSKGKLDAKDILTLSCSGKTISGFSGKPTTELPMHLAVYRRRRSDVSAVIHAHPPYATALSIVGESLMKNYLPEVVLTLGGIPTAKSKKPGFKENAKAVFGLAGKYDAILLERHGVITFGKTLACAFEKLERVEHSAKVIAIAKMIGNVSPLSRKFVKALHVIARSI